MGVIVCILHLYVISFDVLTCYYVKAELGTCCFHHMPKSLSMGAFRYLVPVSQQIVTCIADKYQLFPSKMCYLICNGICKRHKQTKSMSMSIYNSYMFKSVFGFH
ncbi:hypothetical protein ACOSQ3_013791 [Xanthoceras sorbifolium]